MIELLGWPTLEERRRASTKIQEKTVKVKCEDLHPSVPRNRRSKVANSRQLESVAELSSALVKVVV